MDNRIVEFIRGLRAGGVTVSTAEGVDALAAVGVLGIQDRIIFKESLRTTLVKEQRNFEVFDELFDLYFGQATPPLQNAFEALNNDEQDMLRQALSEFDERIEQLLEWLTSGDAPSAEELERMAQMSGIQWVDNPQHGFWVTRRMLQQMGFGQLTEKLEQLMQRLQEMGMSQESRERISGVIEINREELQEYVAEQVGLQIAQRRAERPNDIQGSDLTQKPFSALSEQDILKLRVEIQRMIQQMKTRAALRRKRQTKGKFDARQTIRHSQRYAGIPFELKRKKKKLKPNIVMIFDVSNSMRRMVEFMLHFVSELQDQVSKTRSFAFYDNLAEVSRIVNAYDVRQDGGRAFLDIQSEIPGYLWRTNLGYSLNTFYDKYLSAVDGRTTVIIVGDGRNNYYDPRLDLVKDLQRRAKRLIWFTPESERIWGTGDSDMHHYAPLCDAVYPVRNLAQLSVAVDRILVDH
ncbi:MAG: VWA domain-containing protein [Anaerolineales bacterium]|nr:VWA domain-containing protein [Anaerolineales bacterium]